VNASDFFKALFDKFILGILYFACISGETTDKKLNKNMVLGIQAITRVQNFVR
jgi:hypothetical protein